MRRGNSFSRLWHTPPPAAEPRGSYQIYSAKKRLIRIYVRDGYDVRKTHCGIMPGDVARCDKVKKNVRSGKFSSSCFCGKSLHTLSGGGSVVVSASRFAEQFPCRDRASAGPGLLPAAENMG